MAASGALLTVFFSLGALASSELIAKEGSAGLAMLVGLLLGVPALVVLLAAVPLSVALLVRGHPRHGRRSGVWYSLIGGFIWFIGWSAPAYDAGLQGKISQESVWLVAICVGAALGVLPIVWLIQSNRDLPRSA